MTTTADVVVGAGTIGCSVALEPSRATEHIRNGAPLRVSTFRQQFGMAAEAIGVPKLHPHLLRHTAASLAIASGADVKVVQQMLGHACATMTLDTYGHLFEDRLDEVGSAMDVARRAA